MGICNSRQESAAVASSRVIEKRLVADNRKQADEIKFLLLGARRPAAARAGGVARIRSAQLHRTARDAGAGESGKSTVLKQMQLIHGGGFAESERHEKVHIIYQNTISSLQARRARVSARQQRAVPRRAEMGPRRPRGSRSCWPWTSSESS